ncbi:MAG TPA: NAD(P)/FAD-dependent oxidoreductase [Acidimicrobiia bacterium]|nr:NAD(P)/FAD-dependent oxidoreductase [Acidimicrobiia bacterium]
MPDALSRAELDSAVDLANIPTLLLVLVQITGDLRWLEPPYRPTAARGLDENDSGGVPDAVQAEVRAAAVAAIAAWQDGQAVALSAPAPALLVHMLSVAMGEPVPDEYGPMIAAEVVGDRDTGATCVLDPPPGFSALIIGAGLSGLCAAVRLGQAGVPYTVVERNPEVGGVWLENRYPAAGVDAASHLYSFSFAPADWPHYFATRQEVHDYLAGVASRFGVVPNTRFGTEVRSAVWDADRQTWSVDIRTADGSEETLEANVLISAVGAFNTPAIPPIPGLDSFSGPVFHTARWPTDVDVDGRRVAVIGNGASAMQVVPAIAERVAALTVLARSPHWIAPFDKLHQPVPAPLRRLLDAVPLYRRWYRTRLAWIFNDRAHPVLQKDPAWPHPERAVNAANDRYREFLTDYIKEQLADRCDLLPAVLPTYPPFGKRLLLDHGWYRALRRDNVELVTDPLDRVETDRIVTRSGLERPVDVIVLATGFAVTRFLSTYEIRGRSGVPLRELWRDDDARAYLGTVIPDFPNFFVLYGPNTQPGHGGSVVAAVEAQMEYVMQLLRRMVAGGLGSIEVKPSVHEAYNERVDAAHEAMVWTHPGMDTYYRNSRGRVVVNTPFRIVDFWHMTRAADLEEFVTEPATVRV